MRRGDVYQLRHTRSARGREQTGPRFGVVVQATRHLHMSRWAVAPTTTSPHARPGILRPVIDWGEGPTTVLCDGMESVDPEERLGRLAGSVSLSELQEIDRALRFLLDL